MAGAGQAVLRSASTVPPCSKLKVVRAVVVGDSVVVMDCLGRKKLPFQQFLHNDPVLELVDTLSPGDSDEHFDVAISSDVTTATPARVLAAQLCERKLGLRLR